MKETFVMSYFQRYEIWNALLYTFKMWKSFKMYVIIKNQI